MDLAETKSILHDTLAKGVAVGNDVGGVEELPDLEVAHGTAHLVGPDVGIECAAAT